MTGDEQALILSAVDELCRGVIAPRAAQIDRTEPSLLPLSRSLIPSEGMFTSCERSSDPLTVA